MKTFNVNINDKPVNQFETETEAYEFAVAIEAGETTEKLNKSDVVTFEGENGVYTTESKECEEFSLYTKRLTQHHYNQNSFKKTKW